MTRKIITMLLTWIGILAALSVFQVYLTKEYSLKLFPDFSEYIPHEIIELQNSFGEQARLQAKPVEKEKTNFLYSGENFKNLNSFFSALNKLENGKRKKVRILHFGDSIIWGDTFSYRVKQKFQHDYGDGGRGIVNVIDTPSTKLMDHTNRTRRGFRMYQLRHYFENLINPTIAPPLNKNLGFFGKSYLPLSPRATTIHSVPEGFDPWQEVRLILRSRKRAQKTNSSYSVAITHDNGKILNEAAMEPGESGVIDFSIPASRKVSINFEGSRPPLPFIDALILETGKGVAYSTAITMGTHMAWMDAIPEENLSYGLKQARPDLIIYQYGINEAATIMAVRSYDADDCYRAAQSWFKRIKKILPNTNVLIIGPLERMKKRHGVFNARPEVLQVREIQRRLAKELGFAFFDTYAFCGGPGHMRDFVRKGWAISDHIHITRKGGDFVAKGFYDILINNYKRFLGKSDDITDRKNLKIKSSKNMAIQFNSKAYVYFLLTVLLAAALIARFKTFRFVFLIAASYYFYATWKVWPIALLIFSTLLDYFCGRNIGTARQKGGRGTIFLIISLFGNLGLLFAFKYFDFIAKLVNTVLLTDSSVMQIPLIETVLPVGISFYTFQTLSYTIDIWRGTMEPERKFSKFALFVAFFPQLVAGPIVRASQFLPTLKEKTQHFAVTHRLVLTALFMIMTGLIKKMGADWLAVNIVDRVYDNPQMFTSLETITAIYAYGLQIYGDFSGYTDIAIGSAMLLGFNLTENFNRPYMSSSITDFWRRWHISLGSWFRDYLYFSMGGSRRRVYLNLGITMFLCGLWHGAGIQFVLWGLFHGLFLAVERLTGYDKEPAGSLARGIKIFVTLHLVLFGWVIFRSNSWETFTGVLGSASQLSMSAPNLDILLISVIAFFYLIHFSPLKFKSWLEGLWIRFPAPLHGAAAASITVFLYNIAIADIKPFIYFQF